MNTPMPKLVVLFLLTAFGPTVTEAQTDRPFQVALFAPIQAFPETDNVRGVRLSLLYGKNADVTGWDWALGVAHATGDFLGVQNGGVALTEGNFTGVQSAFVNVTLQRLEGLQLGLVSVTDAGEGAQISAGVNHARNFRGLQLALVNYAESLYGVQIGLVNIIRRGGVLPVMPIVNWSVEEPRTPN